MKNDYVVVTHLTPWGQSYNGQNALATKTVGGSWSGYTKKQNDFCNEWNRTHAQKAWISGSIYLKWPGRDHDEKLYDIYSEANAAVQHDQDMTLAKKVVDIIEDNNKKLNLSTGISFDWVQRRRDWIASHPDAADI